METPREVIERFGRARRELERAETAFKSGDERAAEDHVRRATVETASIYGQLHEAAELVGEKSAWDQEVVLTIKRGLLIDVYRFIDDQRDADPRNPEVPTAALPILDRAIDGSYTQSAGPSMAELIGKDPR